jgi:hypothetical protein
MLPAAIDTRGFAVSRLRNATDSHKPFSKTSEICARFFNNFVKNPVYFADARASRAAFTGALTLCTHPDAARPEMAKEMHPAFIRLSSSNQNSASAIPQSNKEKSQ